MFQNEYHKILSQAELTRLNDLGELSVNLTEALKGAKGKNKYIVESQLRTVQAELDTINTRLVTKYIKTLSWQRAKERFADSAPA